MKINFFFDLDDEESQDSYNYQIFSKAEAYYKTCHEVDSYLRTKLKHGDNSEEVYDALEKVRDLLWEHYPGDPE